jgi:hypothetical protein
MNVTDYEKYLVKRLEKMHPKYRLVFALWCLHEIISKCRELFDKGMRKEDSDMIIKEIDIILNNVVNENITNINEIKEKFSKLECDEDMYPLSRFYIELIGGIFDVVDVIEKGNAEYAASEAIHLINCIDLELDQKGITPPIDSFMSYPDVRMEWEAQSRMLDYLDTSPTLGRNDVERFR